jgi:4-hydroxybenzoate polyprenyltransferase
MYLLIKPYIELCRVSNLPTVWTNVLAAMVLTQQKIEWSPFFLLVASMSLFYSAGMCLNDAMDAEIDTQLRPNRPIPSGRVSQYNTYLFAILFLASAVSLLFTLPFKRSLISGLVLAGFIVAYNIYHKRHAASIFLMAACRLMIYVVTSVALSGALGIQALAVGAIQFIYTLLVSAVARHENNRGKPYPFPVIPYMIAAMSIVDGIAMALLVSFWWLIAGIAGMALTVFGQKYVRGD